MGVNINVNDIDGEIMMNWVYGKQQDMAAFLLVYCGITVTDNMNALATRNETNCCYKYKNSKIYINGKKREAKPYFEYWEKIIRLCFSAAKNDFDSGT